MAAVGILMVGVGAWLMYEAYKGRSISDIKTLLAGTTKQVATGTPVTNTLDTGASS